MNKIYGIEFIKKKKKRTERFTGLKIFKKLAYKKERKKEKKISSLDKASY